MPKPKPLPPDAFSLPSRDLAWAAFDAAHASLLKTKGDFDASIRLLPRHWRAVYTLMRLDGDVQNGGFHQFFTNQGDVVDSFLLDDLSAVGTCAHTSVIVEAFSIYRGVDYTDQWANRGRSWETFTAGYKDGHFDEVDSAYDRIEPDLSVHLGAFVAANREKFDATAQE